MLKKIIYRDKAFHRLKIGIEKLVKLISVTLGPNGKHIIFGKNFNFPKVTIDGKYIIKDLELKNIIENIGLSLIKQAGNQTNNVAGDGVTTTIILAYSMIKEGLKSIKVGTNSISLQNGMKKATDYLVKAINEIANPIKDVETIQKIAYISSNNNYAISKLIANAFSNIGKDGLVMVEETENIETKLEIVKGMKFNKGFLSPHFVTNSKKMEVTYNNPYILLMYKKIISLDNDLLIILEHIKKIKSSLLIIVDDINKEVLTTLTLNKLRNILNVVVIRIPGLGDSRKLILQDIAILTGSTIIENNKKINFDIGITNFLGIAKRIYITKDSTTIVGNKLNIIKIKERCEQLRKQINICETLYEKEKLQRRLAQLSGGIVLIRLGDISKIQLKEKKLCIENSIHAVRSSIEEGVISGGGTLLVHLHHELLDWAQENLKEDEYIGAKIVAKSILFPVFFIAKNSGKNGYVILSKVQEGSFGVGYDVINNKFVDFFKEGIIDPAKVVRSSLQNATSIASMILTTENIIINT